MLLYSIRLPGPAPQTALRSLILRLDDVHDLLVARDNAAVEAHGLRVEPVRVVVGVGNDRLALRIERGEDVERPHEPRDVDRDRVAREVHSGADATPEAERQLKVEQARVRSLDEPLRTERLGLREQSWVFHDSTMDMLV